MKEERYEILRNISHYIDNYDEELKKVAAKKATTNLYKLSKYEQWLIAVSLAGEIIRKWGDEAGYVDSILNDYFFDFLDCDGNDTNDTREVAELMIELYQDTALDYEGRRK